MSSFPSLAALLAYHARRSPDAVAITAPGAAPLTYGRLYEHVTHTARRLNELGVGRHDRLALVLPNGPETAVAFLAVALAAAAAPLNPAFRRGEFDYFLADIRARALLVPSGVDSPARAAARQRGLPILELAPSAEGPAGLFELRGQGRPLAGSGGLANPDDVALILHTSGTTARPKIVPLTHAHLAAASGALSHSLQLTENDCCLNALPLFHGHGLIVALTAPLAAGGRVVCTTGPYATQFLTWLEECSPTWLSGVPTMYQSILRHAEGYGEAARRHRLRFFRSGAAPLPPVVRERL
jgi:acyl-CoA synthetase (AMP-forming)/AMP-acid ligase II